MKTKKLYLILIAWCTVLSDASAQWSWHAKAGAGLSTLSGYKTKFELKAGAGFHVGVGASYDLGSGFGLQSTLMYVTRSFNTEGTAYGSWPYETETFYKRDFDASSLELPVQVSYAIGLGEDVNLKIMTGPSFGYGLDGSCKTVSTDVQTGESAVTKGDYYDYVTDDRFDVGWNVGLMLDYKRFLIGLDGTWGISGHSMFGNKGNKANNVRYSLSVGYRF